MRVASTQDSRYEQFRTRLRQARLDADLTQVDVARALGRHQSFVAKCESGERRIDIIELLDFCKVYRRPLAAFVEGIEPLSPTSDRARRTRRAARRPKGA